MNTVRPCRATKEIPAVRLAADQARMKALATPLAEHGLRFAVTVGPTAMVSGKLAVSRVVSASGRCTAVGSP